jgi:hypothetical protein
MSKRDQSKDSSDAAWPYQDENSDLIESDPDLAALAAYLDATAPIDEIDPDFRESLQSSLISQIERNGSKK